MLLSKYKDPILFYVNRPVIFFTNVALHTGIQFILSDPVRSGFAYPIIRIRIPVCVVIGSCSRCSGHNNSNAK